MLNLVVIGDSIAKGYGSEETSGGFGALLGQKLDANVTNLGVVGLDSSGLLARLDSEKFQTAIKEADVICVSIGSNDLLKPFLSTFAASVGTSGEEKELFAKIQRQLQTTSKNNVLQAANMLSTAMKTLTGNKELQKSCDAFPANFDQIISQINDLNAEAVIYVNNIYNPYYGVAYEFNGVSVFNVQQLCEDYIQRVNKAFDSQSQAYTLMDMYSVFRQTGLTHVSPGSLFDLGSINFDPHPNDAGYQMMADYIYTRMDSTMPEIISFEQITENQTVNGVRLEFSEEVRIIKGKTLSLQSDTNEDVFVYTIKDTKYLKKDEQQKVMLELSLQEFLADSHNQNKELKPGARYQLKAGEGAIKDKGNNQLKEQSIGTIELALQTEAVVQTGASTVKNIRANTLNIWAVAATLGVLAIVSMLLIWKSRKRKKQKESLQ